MSGNQKETQKAMDKRALEKLVSIYIVIKYSLST